jgi:hypothetical protein
MKTIKVGDLINVEQHGYAYISDINYHSPTYGRVYMAKMLDNKLLSDILLFEDMYGKGWKLCENQ